MTKIAYQLYDNDLNCIHLEHPTDIVPVVGDIMEFSVNSKEKTIFCKVVKRQYTNYNILIIILEKLF